MKLPCFDVLREMAENNPGELEELREYIAQTAINKAPEHRQARLQGLQFQINSQRQLAKNPMHACIYISQLMHESMEALRDAFLHPPGTTTHQPIPKTTHQASIVPFPYKSSSRHTS